MNEFALLGDVSLSRFYPAEQCPELWIHIDAAWAGAALGCPEFRELLHLDAINKYAQSFCMNPHKVCFVLLKCMIRICSIGNNPPVGPG